MADLYVLRHREVGALRTFPTRDEAEVEMRAVLRDEPDWASDLCVDSFSFVAGQDEPDTGRASTRPRGLLLTGLRRHSGFV